MLKVKVKLTSIYFNPQKVKGHRTPCNYFDDRKMHWQAGEDDMRRRRVEERSQIEVLQKFNAILLLIYFVPTNDIYFIYSLSAR